MKRIIATIIRNHTIDVQEGKPPGQLKAGEPVLEDEESNVLRSRKRVPQLGGTQEVDRRQQ